MMYYYDGFWPFHIFGALFSVFFWIFLIWLIVRILRRPPHWHGFHMGDSAMEILRERYAKGEINKEQFEEMKKNLTRHTQ